MDNNISNQAEELVRKYNAEGLAPFPFEKIRQDNLDLDVYVSEGLDDKISGVISFDFRDSKFKILVNKNKPEVHQYFTLAHELGHYFLHREIIKQEEMIVDGDYFFDNNISLYRAEDKAEYPKIEAEANSFAASLIMPRELVARAWQTLKRVEEVAKIFRVSISAMSIRLEKLGFLD